MLSMNLLCFTAADYQTQSLEGWKSSASSLASCIPWVILSEQKEKDNGG